VSDGLDDRAASFTFIALAARRELGVARDSHPVSTTVVQRQLAARFDGNVAGGVGFLFSNIAVRG
jgi:hypothetical protein